MEQESLKSYSRFRFAYAYEKNKFSLNLYIYVISIPQSDPEFSYANKKTCTAIGNS